MKNVELKEFNIINFGIDTKNLNRNTIEELKKSIAHIGLLNPAVVTKKGTLVAGRHRATAMRELGYETIIARVIGFGKKEKRELATIQENLARNVYRRHERARLVGKQEELLRKLDLASQHGGDRKTKSRDSQLEPASKQIKKMTGQSERTVLEDLQIHNGIPKELDSLILSSTISDNRDALLRIAKANTEKKEIVAKDLIAKAADKMKSKKRNVLPVTLTPLELLTQANSALQGALSKITKCNASPKKKKAHQLLELTKEIETKLDTSKIQISAIKEQLKG